jgi:hypothetical protein
MRADQTCEIVRDLLPSVNEGLTSEKTTKWVMEHLDTCPECKEKYDILNEVDPAGLDKPSKQEMDRDVKYLRKVKKRLFITIPIAVVCACAILLTGYYFLHVKKFFVPASAMTVYLDQDFPDSSCSCDITLTGRYAAAVKEDDEILYIKDSESSNHVDYTIRYSYFLWDYLFTSKETRTEHLSISRDFVSDEYPGMSILNTPARLLILGSSEADSKVLWSSMKILPAVKAIVDRFVTSADAYDPSKTNRLKAIYERNEVILGTLKDGIGFGISPWLIDRTASDQLVLHDIYILVRNMNLSDNDLVTLKDSAVLFISTTETTATEISNNDSSAPDEKVKIIKLGLYTLPYVQMEAQPDIDTSYIGVGYNFSLTEGKWLFEKTGEGISISISGGDNSMFLIQSDN